MDIDDYLKEKKSLEEQKAILEGKEKLSERKERQEKRKASAIPSRDPAPKVKGGDGSGFSMKHLMIINTVILLGVLAIFATFYLFPPGNGDAADVNKVTGKTVLETDKTTVKKEENTTKTTVKKEENTTNTTVVYFGPQFDLSVRDITEGAFDDRGRLANSGNILVVNGPTFYDEFELAIQNKEKDKIFCVVDRKVDIDTDLDGRFDIEGSYSLNRHSLEIEPLAKELLKAGVVSLPGIVDGYQGKGEVAAEYEVRCYFCLDGLCSDYDKEGEEIRKTYLRVRINEHLFVDKNDTNKSN